MMNLIREVNQLVKYTRQQTVILVLLKVSSERQQNNVGRWTADSYTQTTKYLIPIFISTLMHTIFNLPFIGHIISTNLC